VASEPSERIGGFQVIRRLATGQTSEVLLARADGPFGFERPVVLKRLLPNYRDDPAFGRMFAREATAYARLTHPAIVKLYDFFAGDGQLVMVLEYVDGLSLDRLIALLQTGNGAGNGQHLDDRASLFIGWRIFTALAAAHAAIDPVTEAPAPVVHRDVNPSNVFVPWDGHVKLGDFGVARVAGMGGDTQLGLVQGTFGYLAPEQVRGETVTTAADIYAASLVVWELLAQRRAFRRGSLPDVELLRIMAEPEIPSLDVLRADLDPSLRRALARGLSRNPADRVIGAEEMAGIIRVSGRLEEGREVLVQAAARARRGAGSSSRSLPALLDNDSITQAVASFKTHSPEMGIPHADEGGFGDTKTDARPFFPVSQSMLRGSTHSGPTRAVNPSVIPSTTPTRGVRSSSAPVSSGRLSRPELAPPSERSGPVVTSLIGWNETAVPFEHAPHEIIPETLRGDLPPPMPPLTDRTTHRAPVEREYEPAPTMRRVSDSPDVHHAPTAMPPPPRPSSFGMVNENPSQPDLTVATPHVEQSAQADLLRPPIAPTPVVNASPVTPSPPLPPVTLVTSGAPMPLPLSTMRSNAAMASLPPIPLAVARPPASASAHLALEHGHGHDDSARLWKRVAIGAPIAALVVVVALFGWSRWMHGDASAAAVTQMGKTPPTAPSSIATALSDEPSGGLATATTGAGLGTSDAGGPVAANEDPAPVAVPVAAVVTAPVVAAPSSPAPAVPSSAAPAAAPAGVATLRTSDKLGGHRVFVDGKVVGNSPGPLTAPCGTHKVKIGSSGTEVEKDLVCGAETMIP
jgi:serine/threonine-protein kinase